MGTDYRAIKKNHAEGLIPVFDLFKEALPHTELRPANEQLCRDPPATKLIWYGAPFRAVLMAPENRGYCPPQVLRRGLALRTHFLDQSFPSGLGGIGKDRLHHLIINTYAVRSVIQDLTGPSF